MKNETPTGRLRFGLYLALDVLLVPLRLALWPIARLSEWMDRSVDPWIRRGVRGAHNPPEVAEHIGEGR